MRVKRPVLVTFIGDLNIFNIFLLIASFLPKPKFTEQFGIYFSPTPTFLDGIIRILMVISLLIISYGFLKLKRWGYWLMIAYNLFFLIVSMAFLLKQNGQSYNTPGYITSLIGLIITFPSKRYFIKENESS
jgi:hypothetical protein